MFFVFRQKNDDDTVNEKKRVFPPYCLYVYSYIYL